MMDAYNNRPKLIQKWEDMAEYGHIALKSYRKEERFVLAHDTRRCLWDLGVYMQRACEVRSISEKLKYMDMADLELSRLKLLVRLAHTMKILSTKKYTVWSPQIVEIGKMIGGWKQGIITQNK